MIVGTTAHAEPVVLMSGNVSYSHTANTAVLAVDRIDNLSVAEGITSNLRQHSVRSSPCWDLVDCNVAY